MATNGPAFATSVKLNPSFVVLVFLIGLLARVSLATDPNAESHDYARSRQFRKNIAVSKYRNNTFWLPEFQWTEPKLSTEPRKRPKWETNDDRGGDKKQEGKSEWQKKMEEISRKEREKWKNYRAKRSASIGRENRSRLPRNSDVPTDERSRSARYRSGGRGSAIKKSAKSITDSRNSAEAVKKSLNPGEEDRFELTDEFLDGEEKNVYKKNVRLENRTVAKFPNKVVKKDRKEGDEARTAGKRRKKNSFERSENFQSDGTNDPRINSIDKATNGTIEERTSDKSAIFKVVSDRSNGGVEKTAGKIIPGENLFLRSRSGLNGGVEPADRFPDEISRTKNGIEGREVEVEDEEEIKRHVGLTKESGGRKNLILKSKNEYWIKDEGDSGGKKAAKHRSKNSRRLTETLKKLKQLLNDRLIIDGTDDRKLIGTDCRGGGDASRLIKIIIAPYAAVGGALDRIESSIDRPYPETNGDSRMMELRPIVIGLPTKLCDKHG